MSDYRERTRKEFLLPSSVQELIPIVKISRDGIFQLEKGSEEEEKQYDRAYLFDDTNYSTMDEAEKKDFLKLYVSILNSMNIPFKIILMNNNRDMEKVRKQLYLHARRNSEEVYAKDFNSQVEDALLEGGSGMERCRILLVSCRKKTYEKVVLINHQRTVRESVRMIIHKATLQ